MIPLKLKLWRIENLVVMKVLQQDESTRSHSIRMSRTLWEDKETGIDIMTNDYPTLCDCLIYVRGAIQDDSYKISSYRCGTAYEAKEYIDKIKRTVANYNASLRKEEAESIECEDFEIHIAE